MKHVELFTAISCKGPAPQQGGWGAVVCYRGKCKEDFGGFTGTKSSRLEIRAVSNGLALLKEPCEVTVYVANQNLIDTFEKGWLDNWNRKGELLRSGGKIKNKDLWLELHKRTQIHTVRFARYTSQTLSLSQLKRAKELAVSEAEKNNLPPDIILEETTFSNDKAVSISAATGDYSEDERKEIQRTKSLRGAWHSHNIEEVTKQFGNVCQQCGIQPPAKKGVAHHLSYPAEYWLIPVEQKIRENIITFLCRNCHQAAHTAHTYQQYREDSLKHSGYCHVCKEFTWDLWKRYNPVTVPIPLCMNCVAALRDGQLAIIPTKSEKS